MLCAGLVVLPQDKTVQKRQLQFHERTRVPFVKSSFMQGRQYFCLTDWPAVIMQLKMLLSQKLVESTSGKYLSKF